MGPTEAGLRQQYQSLAAELGDCMMRRRINEARIKELYVELDRLNGALPSAQQADQRAMQESPKG